MGAVLVFHDVTEPRRMAQQMAHDATHDALTNLANRREFERRLERALASAKQFGSRHALCYLDLDQFKLVNDAAGHAAGDELLRQIRGLLAGKFRGRDTLARLGGDEFGLLLENCELERALRISDMVIATLRNHRFAWQQWTFHVGVSIGLVSITADAESATQLLTQADVACYTAKERGGNRAHVYQREGTEPPESHAQILRAATLRDSLEKNRFRLYCQPIMPLSPGTDTSVRYEFLLRMVDAEGELVRPREFIPAAERYGLMSSIDRWVIRSAFRHLAETSGGISQRKIFINLSANSLDDDSLPDYLSKQFDEFPVSPESVCLEISRRPQHSAILATFLNSSQKLRKAGSAWPSMISEAGSLLFPT